MVTPTVSTTLQSAATTGNGSVHEIGNGDMPRYIVVYTEATGTISGGTVLIEEARTSGYSGTWAQVASVTPVTSSVLATHLTGAYANLRARISSNITGGGTVTVTCLAYY